MNDGSSFEISTFKGQFAILVYRVLSGENLVLFTGLTADVLTDANFFLLERALFLNLRLQKPTIVFF